MTFGSPWMLLLLPVIPALVAAYVRSRRRRARRSASLASQGLVLSAASSRMPVRRHVPFAFFAVALTLLLIGMARPMTSVKTPKREGTVILAIDVSNSMKADDVKPSRIEAAQTAARAFVERQPLAVRIGVVAFGDGALLVQTPTNAHPDVIKAIDRLSTAGGTAVGQALVTALGAIAGKPVTIDAQALASDAASIDIGYFGSATVVLLSDGDDTGRPDPVSVAEVASVAGVRVHTIGIGTAAGAVVQIDGFSVATALDAELLKKVAETTDGSYHQAADAGDLAEISKTIDLRFKVVSEHIEVSGLFASGGAALLFVGALLSVLWFGRVV